MRIFNQDKTEELQNPDLEVGYLYGDTLINHIPEQIGKEEVSHYEVIKEYPNGGQEVVKIIDTPAIEAGEAHDEIEGIMVYVPYTQEELTRRTLEQEMTTLKQYLNDTDYTVIKCQELGLVYAEEYPDIAVERQQARNRINEIEALLN